MESKQIYEMELIPDLEELMMLNSSNTGWYFMPLESHSRLKDNPEAGL